MHNGNTHPPVLCAGEASDERLKINELGPNDGNKMLSTDGVDDKKINV